MSILLKYFPNNKIYAASSFVNMNAAFAICHLTLVFQN